jgi:hypothetical protein
VFRSQVVDGEWRPPANTCHLAAVRCLNSSSTRRQPRSERSTAGARRDDRVDGVGLLSCSEHVADACLAMLAHTWPTAGEIRWDWVRRGGTRRASCSGCVCAGQRRVAAGGEVARLEGLEPPAHCLEGPGIFRPVMPSDQAICRRRRGSELRLAHTWPTERPKRCGRARSSERKLP